MPQDQPRPRQWRQPLDQAFPEGFAVAVLLLTVGVFCFIGALRTQGVMAHLGFFGVAVGLSGVAIFLFALQAKSGLDARSSASAFKQVLGRSADPALLGDGAGLVLEANGPARELGPADGKTVVDWVAVFADDAAALVYRLLRGSDDAPDGNAREAVMTRDGQTLQVLATRLTERRVLWTLLLTEQTADAHASARVAFPVMKIDDGGAVTDANGAAKLINDGATPDRPEELVREGHAHHGDFVHLSDAVHTRVRVHSLPEPDGSATLALLPVSADEIARALPIDFMDMLPVALARIEADGRLTYANREARRLLGRTPAAGQPLDQLVEGLSRPVPERVADMMGGRSHNPTEMARVRIDGEERYIQLTLKRMELDGAASLLAVMADATEFKALEAQFVQSQKMQAVGQLAGGMAHDFNNLLTAISGHCDLLLLRHAVTDPDYEDLKQINQNSARAAALVAKLLAFSRKQTMIPKVVSIEGTFADLRHLLNRLLGERVNLRIEQSETLPKVRIDERQLEQVIMNLVVNARDAMPGGGDVTIRTTAATYSQNTDREGATIPAGDYLRIDVTDTGSGIPDDVIGKIFEPFFTTKGIGKGTGLGLSTAYGIIKQMGGFIFATSKIKLGTTFTILLPAYASNGLEVVSRTEANGTANVASVPRDLSGRGVILLVEDERPVRSVAARVLTTRGYKVLEAETAEEALEILEDDDLHVDMFVSDVIMPGKDGPTWVREARKKRPDTKVIFVSGYAEDVLDSDDLDIENAVFLPKPFSLVELSHTVKQQFTA